MLNPFIKPLIVALLLFLPGVPFGELKLLVESRFSCGQQHGERF